MKKGFILGLLFLCGGLLIACNSNASYTKLLNQQKKAISRFMDENDYVVIKDYPADGVFKPNEFYVLDNGVYMNVVDSGNGNRAVSGQTSVLCRSMVRGLIYNSADLDTAQVNNFDNGTNAIKFVYGSSTASTSDTYTQYFFSTALFSPLEYVGDSAVVKLLIPFDQASSYYQSIGDPLYFSKVQYKFEPR
jgi:hypothetical protein